MPPGTHIFNQSDFRESDEEIARIRTEALLRVQQRSREMSNDASKEMTDEEHFEFLDKVSDKNSNVEAGLGTLWPKDQPAVSNPYPQAIKEMNQRLANLSYVYGVLDMCCSNEPVREKCREYLDNIKDLVMKG